MKMTNTPPLKEISALNAYKFILVAISMLTYSINANAQVNTFTNVQVTNTMTTNGNAVFNSSVRLSNLSGGSSLAKIMVDQNGFLLKGPEVPTTWECLPFTPNWNIGGNNAYPLISVPGSTIPYADIGTCDLVDFMLKANNKHAQWIKPDGSVMFGTGVGSNSGGPEYRFNEGVIRLQGLNSYGGPQVIFDGGVNPFGDWGIEYLSSTVTAIPGLNFWKPSYSPNSYNYLFFISDSGKVSVGGLTEPTSARFNVDGWSGDANRAKVNASRKAYTVFNKTTSQENFAIWGNGRTQIGSVSPNPNAMLNITSSPPVNAIEVRNSTNQNNIGFSVQGDGSAIISSNNPFFSLDIKDVSNTTNFRIQSDGSTIIRGGNNSYALQVIDLTNTPNFRVKSNGEVYARFVKVTLQSFPDYVFKDDYKLDSISEMEKFYKANHHLKGIPSEEEIITNHLDLGEISAATVKIIEEHALYITQLHKQILQDKEEIVKLHQKLQIINDEINVLKNKSK